MRDLWLKIKVWSKIIFLSLLVIYALVFTIENSGQRVDFWYWYNSRLQASLFVFALLTFAAGVIATLLFAMVKRTFAQLHELRTAKEERLQIRPPITAQASPEPNAPPSAPNP